MAGNSAAAAQLLSIDTQSTAVSTDGRAVAQVAGERRRVARSPTGAADGTGLVSALWLVYNIFIYGALFSYI